MTKPKITIFIPFFSTFDQLVGNFKYLTDIALCFHARDKGFYEFAFELNSGRVTTELRLTECLEVHRTRDACYYWLGLGGKVGTDRGC